MEQDQQWPSFRFLRDNTSIMSLKIFRGGNKGQLRLSTIVEPLIGIGQNQSLESLSLGRCDFSDELADLLCQLGRDNKSLKQTGI